MESTLVSARINRAKKERGGSVLASMGATVSDLINSAFDYVIENGKLPSAREDEAPRDGDFATFVRESTLDVEWPEGFGGDYKDLMAQMRTRDYEALA